MGEQFGTVSRVAYTPDSFGHPSQFPQIFAGFGLDGFVYWRGNGDELDDLPPVYHWVAPDGSSVVACHLTLGYFAAAYLPDDIPAAVLRLRELGDQMTAAGARQLLFMNGIDHAMPDPHTGAVARALEQDTGWTVTRGRLEDFTARAISSAGDDRFAGELIGGRITNLLPGVWSSRLELKLRNRRAETALVGWAEPWASLGRMLGLPDERPALRVAWRALLANQAHDSIGGCSQDRVHDQMRARFDEAQELADETTLEMLSRLAGTRTSRPVAGQDGSRRLQSLTPHANGPRSPPLGGISLQRRQGRPSGRASPDHRQSLRRRSDRRRGSGPGPGRRRARADPGAARAAPMDGRMGGRGGPGVWLAPLSAGHGRRRARTTKTRSRISLGGVTVTAADDGTLSVARAGRRYEGLGGVEDQGDRGDTYDFDPFPGPIRLVSVAVTVADTIAGSRSSMSSARSKCQRRWRPSAPSARRDCGPDGADAGPARHRGRASRPRSDRGQHRRGPPTPARFPDGRTGEAATAATTFDVAPRSPRPAPKTAWFQPPPNTFPHQGWVHNNGLTVVAPGLPEAEVTAEGTIYITVVRAVGWLSRTGSEVPSGARRTGAAYPRGPVPRRDHGAARSGLRIGASGRSLGCRAGAPGGARRR